MKDVIFDKTGLEVPRITLGTPIVVDAVPAGDASADVVRQLRNLQTGLKYYQAP